MRRGSLVACAVLSLLLLGCGDVVSAGRRPDVLLIVWDTVRADRLASYGHTRSTTPHLDVFAQRAGVLFEDCTAPAAWTYPSHASLFTGERTQVHGARLAKPHEQVQSFEREDLYVTRMREDLPTLAERFARGGYRTVALSANGWLAPELGATRGFADVRVLDNDVELVKAALDLMGHEAPRPLFLFVNLMMAHAPYRDGQAPWTTAHRKTLTPEGAPEWLRPFLAQGEPRGVDLARKQGEFSGTHRYLAGELDIPREGFELMLDLYDSELTLLDAAFRMLYEAWTPGRPESIVVVTSDHGEFFGERGLFEHRGHVYPEVLHVPLVIAAPGRLPMGVRVRTPVQLQDLYATLLELAGIAAQPGSLVPVIAGKPRPGAITASAWPAGDRFLLGGRHARTWHLFRLGAEALVFSETGAQELYDVSHDPRMAHDLARERAARLEELQLAASVHFPEPWSTPELALSDEQAERLRALGYLGN